MDENIYLPLLDSSKKFLKLKKVYRYKLKKFLKCLIRRL